MRENKPRTPRVGRRYVGPEWADPLEWDWAMTEVEASLWVGTPVLLARLPGRPGIALSNGWICLPAGVLAHLQEALSARGYLQRPPHRK